MFWKIKRNAREILFGCKESFLQKQMKISRIIFANLFFAFSCFAFSCATPVKNQEEKTPEQKAIPAVESKRVPIDSSGFSIELPSSMKITNQKGGDFMVYYFTPIDTSSSKGEGGIYLGPKPDEHPPTTEYTKTEMLGVFLGQSVQWTVYTTSKYTQREVFVDAGNGQKIHAWCYADNSVELENLFRMMNSIQK